MVVDFIVVGDRTDDMCRDVALVVEGFQTAEDAQVLAFFWLWLRGSSVSITIDPLLYFD